MILTDALVLSRSEYHDYDRMVTLLSPTLGRVDAIARGCRKPKSPLLNAAELFAAGEYELDERQGRYTIRQAQIRESFYALRSDIEQLTAGVYILYLARQASLPGEANDALFMTTLRALAFLDFARLPAALVVMAYELHYMAHLGQAPCVDRCVRCGSAVEGAARFDAKLGGIVCAHCPQSGVMTSDMARRMLLRIPKTRFDVIGKLLEHEQWREAACRAREFVAYRLDAPPKQWPALPECAYNKSGG